MTYICNIVDYSQLGYMYQTNNNLVGIYFKDKSTIYKFVDQVEFHYVYRQKKISKKYNFNEQKDFPSEIKMKLSALQSYEKYLSEQKQDNLININKPNYNGVIYIKKIIATDISFILKLSNNNIEVIMFSF